MSELTMDAGSRDLIWTSDDPAREMASVKDIAAKTSCWNLIAVTTPELAKSDIFSGWACAGTISKDCKTFVKMLWSIRRSPDGCAWGEPPLPR